MPAIHILTRKLRKGMHLAGDGASSQRPYSKDGSQLCFLLFSHLQPPDRGNWDGQNHQIAHEIDDARADEYDVSSVAFVSMRYYCPLDASSHRRDNNQAEGVAKIPGEDNPDTGSEVENQHFILH